MRTVDDLREGDYVVFDDPTDGLIVDNITSIDDDGTITVHYLHDGYKSTHATFRREDVLAIGNPQGEGRIPRWSGRYDIIQPGKLETALAK